MAAPSITSWRSRGIYDAYKGSILFFPSERPFVHANAGVINAAATADLMSVDVGVINAAATADLILVSCFEIVEERSDISGQ